MTSTSECTTNCKYFSMIAFNQGGTAAEQRGTAVEYSGQNNHTVPSLQALEKFARAWGVPLYQFVYEGKDQRPAVPHLLKRESTEEPHMSRKEIQFWKRLRQLLGRM